MSVKTDTGVAEARVHPSPNHGPRPDGALIELVILHYTGMISHEAALRRLCDPQAEVSAHYLVDENGSILQCVPEARRAWHAGRSVWRGNTDVNSRSIGIEIVNPGHEFGYRRFPETQIEAVMALTSDICRRHDIRPWNVLGHSDVAPDRKEDPGEFFPWDRLASAGIGHFIDPFPIRSGLMMQQGERGQPVEALQSMLALYGYGLEITGEFDPHTTKVVAAFQRHFRPERVDGIADQSTIQTLNALLRKLPAL